jgi:nicotinamide mononucleotide (NMN) deamidase PncC
METVVLDLLRRRGLTVAAAETITGGILSARMSAADAAMETFRGARIAPETGASGGRTPEQRAAAAAAQVSAELATRVGLAAIARMPRASSRVAFSRRRHRRGAARREGRAPDRRRMREFSVISLLNLLRRNLSS